MLAQSKSSIFLFDPKIVLKKMKTYSDPIPEPELPLHNKPFFQTPKTVWHSLTLGEALAKRIDYKLSSPTRKHMESYQKGCKQILQVADIQQGDLISIQTATKASLKQKSTNRNYIVGKGLMSARAAIQAVAEKEARKRPKKQKLAILVSSDEDSDYSNDSEPDTEYNSLYPELANWDNGQSNGELIQDPFNGQQDFITFG